MSNADPTILFCHCAYSKSINENTRDVLFDALKNTGAKIQSVADLCKLSAEKDPALAELAQQENLRIAACFPRAVKWLFEDVGASLPDSVPIHNMRTDNHEGLVAEVTQNLPSATGTQDVSAPEPDELDTWTPWFPVIDYDRCTNCMQCLSFCLFDVYSVNEHDQIEVQNQEKCKTNCPACSRVCPEVAIMFPKYKSGPINGDAVSEDDIRREKMQVDISSLLGGDIYQTLRDRHERAKSRFSKERSDERALKERKLCLKKLQEDLDIPPEVLAALPSEDAIQSKLKSMKSHFSDDSS
jgi:Pyruvate/2-oxoacid:ferredoxin oxidoreductase delta subunit